MHGRLENIDTLKNSLIYIKTLTARKSITAGIECLPAAGQKTSNAYKAFAATGNHNAI